MARFDVDGSLQNVKTLLSGLSWWQGICLTDSSTVAAESIFEGGTEKDPTESAAPLIVLDIDPFNSDWMATLRGQLTVTVHTEIPVPEENRETYSDQYRYAWQQFGSMVAGINAGVGGSGQLMLRGLNVRQQPGPFDPKETNNRIEWGWIIDLVIELV